MSAAFFWFLLSGVFMVAVAGVGAVAFLLDERRLRQLLLPLVAFAAGTLLGGAFFHMLPAAWAARGDTAAVPLAAVGGFTVFFVLEQLLHWHHGHTAEPGDPRPLGTLILLGDGIHNLVGGLAIASAFLVDVRLGAATWLAAVVHELPQELGDFGILVHSGWSRRRALVANMASALPFPLGGALVFAISEQIDVTLLLPFAAGTFVYLAASDLVPEVNKHRGLRQNLVHLAAFVAGLALLFAVRAGGGA